MLYNCLLVKAQSRLSEASQRLDLLRDSLDLYLTINPDNVQYLLLQARLYFHLGIWPEKVKTLLFSRVKMSHVLAE